jgi:hypothetical protein
MACRSDAGKFCAEHIGKPPQDECLPAHEQAEAIGRLSRGGRIARRVAHHPGKIVTGFSGTNAKAFAGDHAQTETGAR